MQTYLTYLKHLFLFLQIDPLYYGKINMDPSEKAHLYSGDKVWDIPFIPSQVLCHKTKDLNTFS